MRKILALLLAAGLLLTCGCAYTQKKDVSSAQTVVNLYAAPDAVAQEVLDAFTAKTGIAVKYYKLTDEAEAIRKIHTGVSPFDLVLASNIMMENMACSDLLEPIDRSLLANSAGMLSVTSGAPGVQDKMLPYTRSCLLLVHDIQKTLAPVRGYASLWDVNFASKVNVPAQPQWMSAVALKVCGFPINTDDAVQHNAAREQLCALATNTFAHHCETAHMEVAGGQGALTVAWAKEAQAAKSANPNLEILYPEEGAIVKLNCFAIPTSAPNKKNAYALLDFMLSGEACAAVSVQMQEESLHSRILEYTDEKYEDILAVHMSKKYGEDVECIRFTGLDEYDQNWKSYTEALHTQEEMQ